MKQSVMFDTLVSRPDFVRNGFETIPAVQSVNACIAALQQIEALPVDAAGSRFLLQHGWCRSIADTLRLNAQIASIVPCEYVAVQCTYFEKSLDRNWLVPIHQDLSIPVVERVEHEALAGWSEKQGQPFVQPPVSMLEQLVVIRLHLDPCGAGDGALSVVPGSHALGRMSPKAAVVARTERGSVTCSVPQGGVFAMSPLLLHASSRATGTSRRRVLHFLFGPPRLPFGLRWNISGVLATTATDPAPH